MKKFVFIDIDGTLYDYRNHCVPESAKEALKLAKEKGHQLFICTGRAKEFVERSYLDLAINGVIYGCGAHIEINNELIYEGDFPLDLLKTMIDFFLKNDIEFALEGKQISYFTPGPMKFYSDYYSKSLDSEIGKKFIDGVLMKKYSDLVEEDLHQIIKVAFQAKDRDFIESYLKQLPKELTYFIYSDTFSGDVEGEIFMKGADKADSVQRVVDYFQGNMEDTIALGDSDNDLTMLQKAYVGIAMGNAVDNLKKIADYITAPVYEDGLYQAFQQYDLI